MMNLSNLSSDARECTAAMLRACLTNKRSTQQPKSRRDQRPRRDCPGVRSVKPYNCLELFTNAALRCNPHRLPPRHRAIGADQWPVELVIPGAVSKRFNDHAARQPQPSAGRTRSHLPNGGSPRHSPPCWSPITAASMNTPSPTTARRREVA